MAEKTDILHIRISPDVKNAAASNAQEDRRNLSNYIEWLILQDCAKRKQK